MAMPPQLLAALQRRAGKGGSSSSMSTASPMLKEMSGNSPFGKAPAGKAKKKGKGGNPPMLGAIQRRMGKVPPAKV